MKRHVDKLAQENRELKEKVSYCKTWVFSHLHLSKFLILTIVLDKWNERTPAVQIRGERKPEQEVLRALASINLNHSFPYLTWQLGLPRRPSLERIDVIISNTPTRHAITVLSNNEPSKR